jgi:hypothetical protein
MIPQQRSCIQWIIHFVIFYWNSTNFMPTHILYFLKVLLFLFQHWLLQLSHYCMGLKNASI